MTAPAFEFTTRAAPIVQFGRPERPTGDALWQTGEWGTGHWGKADWEPLIWSDLTCEIHEITVNTGRGSASDRFVPGTAHIVASNVHDVADMIFPRVPGPAYESELVPQPPIQNEEELQAPAAGTLVSNGWSFTDDFGQVGPRWIFPTGWDTYPWGPFKQMHGDYWEPQRYADPDVPSYGYMGAGCAQWSRGVDWQTSRELVITVDAISWPAAPSAGTPTVVFELYARMNTVDKSCDCMRVTYTPGFGATANTIVTDLFRMGPTGTRVTGITTPNTYNLGATNGVFPAFTFGLYSGETTGQFMLASRNGAGVINWTDPTPPAGDRFGVGASFVEGFHTGAPVVPKITHVSTFEFEDDLSRPTGSGWYLPRAYDRNWPATTEMIQTGSAMRPPELFWTGFGGGYRADGLAYFDADFDGDQFIEFDLAGQSMPNPLFGLSQTRVEVFLQGNRQDQSSIRCYIDYLPDWDGGNNTITWEFYQAGPNNDAVYWPDVYGDINLGDVDGMFPDPATWRLEADADGEARLYYDGVLLGAAFFPDPPRGGRVGVWMKWQAGNPPTDTPRPQIAHLDRIAGGLLEPLGTEELGIWIRIGVDHTTLGNQWFLRGCVDGLVPTYVPERPDAVRIECIDTLGEAGRVRIDADTMPHEFAPATTRIHQILNKAHWPRNLMIIREDETIMSRPASGKAVDALTHVAESCGGAIWSDPRNGNIVFKGQDWQGEVAGGPAIAVITNTDPEDPAIDAPRICPVGWERSSQRRDMNTRVRYSTQSSQGDEREPLVREWRAPNAESIYGVELYERTLLCTTGDRLNELARRQLRLRHPNQFPRVEAVLLDAATADEALDLMTMANWMIPSKYRCQLRRGGAYVFNRSYLVTGIQHRMSPERWTCRLALDIASAFAETGARWSEAHWGTAGDTWGRSR